MKGALIRITGAGCLMKGTRCLINGARCLVSDACCVVGAALPREQGAVMMMIDAPPKMNGAPQGNGGFFIGCKAPGRRRPADRLGEQGSGAHQEGPPRVPSVGAREDSDLRRASYGAPRITATTAQRVRVERCAARRVDDHVQVVRRSRQSVSRLANEPATMNCTPDTSSSPTSHSSRP
jgi:hypothetical protein